MSGEIIAMAVGVVLAGVILTSLNHVRGAERPVGAVFRRRL